MISPEQLAPTEYSSGRDTLWSDTRSAENLVATLLRLTGVLLLGFLLRRVTSRLLLFVFRAATHLPYLHVRI